MKAFLAKYVPPLSIQQVEEIAQEHERLVAIQLEKTERTAHKKER